MLFRICEGICSLGHRARTTPEVARNLGAGVRFDSLDQSSGLQQRPPVLVGIAVYC